ncbi:MAG: cytochrome c oxidase assembly protein [Pseudolabrys sp.]|nr:cytochrome c oxidase assembly protein [Pseudolabrys sp.]
MDPVLLSAMAVTAGAHAILLRNAGEWRGKRTLYAALWLLLAALFISPLCALSSALFSVRVAHHVVLIAVAAPILVLSLPDRWRAWPQSRGMLGLIFTLHVAVVWLWHAPAPYAAAMANDLVFWAMQLSLIISAVALWLAVLSPAAPFGYALTLLLGSVIQMGLLGAVITFARVPLYLPHFGTTDPFGLSALSDQQLAGLIMWVPATLPYLGAALLLIGRGIANTPAAGRAS